MGCGLFKAPAPRLRLVGDLPPPRRRSASSRLPSAMRSSPRCPLAAPGRQSQEVPPPSSPPSATVTPPAGGVGGGRWLWWEGPQLPWLREAGGGRVCGVRGGGASDRSILPTPWAALATRPPLVPTPPQVRAPWLDAEPREGTRALGAGAGTAAEPGREASEA
nr:COPII coat assembly protein sec16-like [Equus caballus]